MAHGHTLYNGRIAPAALALALAWLPSAAQAEEPPLTSAAWNVTSSYVDAQLGWSISSAGDVNGDGYDDVIVGAWHDDVNAGPVEDTRGRAFVFHGSPDGLEAEPAWVRAADPVVGWYFAYAFGYSVSGAGDVNGDGYDDVIVGAHGSRNGQGHDGEGMVFVFHGSAAGLSQQAAWSAEANQKNAAFGQVVASAGDVNGDGYADVIIGSERWDTNPATSGHWKGRAFVYHGSPDGLSGGPLAGPEDADWTVIGDQQFSGFAGAVASAGDVNGDGYDDIVVGARAYMNSYGYHGRVFVYHGSGGGLTGAPLAGPDGADWRVDRMGVAGFGETVATAGDVNGDGYDDLLVGYSSEGVFAYYGSEDGLQHGPIAGHWDHDWWIPEGSGSPEHLSTAGDINGDGYDDVIVGDPSFNGEVNNEGRALLYAGSIDGLGTDAVWTADDSNDSASNYGNAVSTAGDVNGDGRPDVIVGASHFRYPEDPWGVGRGRVWAYHGVAADADGDGVAGGSDCDEFDPTLWSPPDEATGLLIAGDRETLSWEPPLVPGATDVRYDLLRSASAGDFTAADCAASDLETTTAVDSTLPSSGTGLYYLVRATNGCPEGAGSLGQDSEGIERAGATCP